ncbi:hypothetical protein HYU45_05000 [Candidatus Daviesbacteria bacterium]|nr:hypothetical protein [Candidatus Daviesbacteria bacterium]
MKENVIIFPGQKAATKTSTEYSIIRALAFKIRTRTHDFTQYVKTVKAYALAKMPFKHIANAGDHLGDAVIVNEVDAPLQTGWQDPGSGMNEDSGKILAWQTRGEKVPVTAELPAPVSITGQEMVIVFNDLATIEKPQEQMIEVVEGINVSQQETPAIFPNSTPDSQLENNPYLQPIDLKKAA